MPNELPTLVYDWPQAPPLPAAGQPVLVRVPTPPARTIARKQVRVVLRQVLARWSSIAPEDLPLEESRRGPVWRGRLAEHNLDISLSYCPHEAWIGLLRGGSIGVDVMRAEPFAEAPAVARNYLGPETVQCIQESPDPPTAFATAWTELEAQLKCLKLSLIENPTRQVLAFPPCALENITFASRVVVSVATCPPFAPTVQHSMEEQERFSQRRRGMKSAKKRKDLSFARFATLAPIHFIGVKRFCSSAECFAASVHRDSGPLKSGKVSIN